MTLHSANPLRVGGIPPRPYRRKRTTLPVWLVSIALIASPAIVIGDSSPAVTVVGSFSKPRSWDGRIAMPYFGSNNQLLWNDDPVTDAGDCSSAWFPQAKLSSARCERRTVMLKPRVDECRCTGKTSNRVSTAIAYAGIDDSSHERWRRQSLTAGQTSGPQLAGATPEGLVFSNFEVWSAHTGETVHTALSRPGSFTSTCYLPDSRAYLKFDADVTLLHVHGGLSLHTSDGKRELVLPVQSTLFGYYTVESIAPVPGTQLVLLGERYTTRGQGSARFELFDLESRRVLFSEERSKGHYIADVRVVAGSDGHVVFSYLDESAGHFQVVHYRIQGQP